MATTFLEAGTDATQDLTFYPNQAIGGSGSVASASDQSHTGARSLKLVTVANSHFLGSPDGACADAGTRLSFWVRFGSTPTTDMNFLSIWVTGFADQVLGLGLTTGGKLQLIHNDNAAQIGASGATTIAATTWTRITLSYVITTTTNWTAKVYVNGALEMTRSNADVTLGFTGSGQVGPMLDKSLTSGSLSALTVWYDDFYIDNGSDLADPGDIRVTAKRPFANGTTNGFTTQIGAGGSGYGSGHAPQVNEQPLSQTNGWSMIGAGSAVTEEYNIEGLTVGDVDPTGATIVDAMGWLFAKALASETGSLVLKGVSSNISLTSTATLFTKAAGSSTYPAGTGTDIGMITTTALTTVSLFELGVLIAFQPSSLTIAQQAGIWAAAENSSSVIGRVDA